MNTKICFCAEIPCPLKDKEFAEMLKNAFETQYIKLENRTYNKHLKIEKLSANK